MKKASVYIETSVVSYLAARPSGDLMIAACQQITTRWWDLSRKSYDIVTSDLVVVESSQGDDQTAQRRLNLLRGIRAIEVSEETWRLAETLLGKGAMPKKAQADALHIAVAAMHDITYLLTWNCRHINNPATKPHIREICRTQGYACPEICTPFEIMELG